MPMGLGGCCAGWGMLAMGLFWLVVIVAFIVGIVLVVRHLNRRPRAEGGDRDAIELLEGRFARGEIDREKFEERRNFLRM